MAKKKVSTGLIPESRRKKALGSAIRGEYEVADAGVFLKVCQANPGYATLTHYTVEQLADSSVFRLWKLKGMELYYGLRIEEPSVELITVISNDTELPGIATGSAILHAIEQGVTRLSAFDLNNFLTERYERYGFVPDDLIRFDPHHTEDGECPWLDESGKGPSQRLCEAEKYWKMKHDWEAQRDGKFATNYPGVQCMKLEATEEERSVARSVYHTHFIKRRVEDLEKAGIQNPLELLKQYGFKTTDEQFIKESRLLTVLTKTAEANHTFENMIRFDTSEPMIKRVRENTIRMKRQRVLEDHLKKKPVRTSPRSPYNSKLNLLIDQAYDNGIGEAFELLVKTGIDAGLPSRSCKNSVMFSPPSDRRRRLFTVWTQQHFISGAARVYVDVEAFEQFMGIPQLHAAKVLGSGTIDLGPKTVEKFAKNLRQLLENKEDRGP